VLGATGLDWQPTSFGATGMYSNTGQLYPYTTAPDSAHVLWTLPEAFGVRLEENSDREGRLYTTGTAYETKFGAVVLYGILTSLLILELATIGAFDCCGPAHWRNVVAKARAFTTRVGMVLKFNTGRSVWCYAYLFTATCLPLDLS